METEKQLLKEYIQYVLDSYKLNEALEVHDTLNPILWNDNQLKDDVKQSLVDIANNFIDNLGFPIDVVDIRFLGSNASYNYNSQSDIDLHIITNFETNYIDDSILQQLYNNEKNSFNNKHDIKVKGIPVEIYIEDMKSMNATNGSYSLLQDKWIKTPEPITYNIPDYSKELDEELARAQNILSNATSSQEVKDEINHIYLMRKDGLAQGGEASIGNLVFKELRNMGIQPKLASKYYELESNELSLESEELVESFKSNKEVLIELVRNADKDSLYYLVYNFGELGFYREDKRRSAKKWVIDCINNCYKDEPSNQFDKTQNTEIENAVFNATHKDKEEYLNESSYPISSDTMKRIIDEGLLGFHWYTEFADSKRKLNILSKNGKKIGAINLDNKGGIFHIHYRGEQTSIEIPDSYDRSDLHYENCIRSIDRTLTTFINSINKKTKSTNKIDVNNGEEDHFTGVRADEDGNTYYYQDGKKIEIASDDDIKNESLNEGTGLKKIAYHVTASEPFDNFDFSKIGQVTGDTHGDGIYFTTNIHDVLGIIDNPRYVLKAEITLNNPYIVRQTKLLDKLDYLVKLDVGPVENFKSKDYYDMVLDIRNDYIEGKLNLGGFPVLDLIKDIAKKHDIRPSDILKDMGFDGIDDGSYIVVYSNDQIRQIEWMPFERFNESLNESEQLNEYTLKDVLDDSKASDPKRIELSKSLYTEYKGVDSDGTLIFETDSQTRSNLGHRQRIFYEGFFDLLDKADQNEEITDEDVVNILTGDLMLDCSCESFLYWAWAYKSWKEEYGLKKETRAPKRNNVNLNGGACKHCLSVLELINRSDSIFDQIAKDLNDLFKHYKKQSAPNVEAEPGDEQFTRTAQNLAKKGKTNKKLKSNPKAAKYDIPKKEEPSGPINRLNAFNNEVMSDTK